MITSMSNNRVKQVVSLQQKAKERKERKCFVIEGLRLFEEAPVELLQEVYVSEQYLDKVKDLKVLKKLPYEVVSADVFQRMSDTKTPQGILAVVKMPEYTMEEILAVEDPLLVLLEDIQALHFKLNAYERILKKHHLLDEAEKLMDDWKKQAVVLPEIADDEGHPFQERRLS